jgi:hypothetical protein
MMVISASNRVFADGQDHHARDQKAMISADQRHRSAHRPISASFPSQAAFPDHAGHQQAQFAFIGLIGVAFAHEAAVEHHGDAVRKRHDLIQFHR